MRIIMKLVECVAVKMFLVFDPISHYQGTKYRGMRIIMRKKKFRKKLVVVDAV